MSEETLSDMLDDKADYLAYKKAKTIEKLGERTHLTLEKIAKLVTHPEHGPVVKDITLDELISAKVQSALEEAGLSSDEDEVKEEDTPKVVKAIKKKRGKKTTVKKKTPTKKAASKAPPKNKKTKKKASVAAKKPAGGRKSDYGKKKPRLNREQGFKEVLAALKAAGEPCGRSDLEKATGYSGVQVRTFCKELAEQGKVEILGKGGRSTKYALA